MASIDRTAYPHFNKRLSDKELSNCYELNDEEQDFIHRYARNDRGYLVLSVILKTRQQLGYFAALQDVPNQIVIHLSVQLEVDLALWQPDEAHYRTTLHRYRTACRKLLESSTFNDDSREQILSSVRNAAHTMSDPADLINVAVEKLSNANIELPAFSTLDRLVGHVRQEVHEALYQEITATLKPNEYQSLDALLQVQKGERITGFARMKQTPGPATLNNFRNWAGRLVQLNDVLDPKLFFENVAYTKIRQFSAEALAYEISDMRGISNDAKRYTLLLSLLHQTQLKTRDELVDMFLRRMKRVQHTARDNLQNLQEKNREMEEDLISILGQVLQHAEGNDANEVLGQHVRETLDARGGIEVLNSQFKLVTAYHNDNYLPLLWSVHAVNRAVIFRVLDLIKIQSSTQDKSLLRALNFVYEHRKTRKDYLPPDIDLQFASQRWQTFIRTMDGETPMLDRRSLEVCVFIHLAEALQGGDLYVEDSGAYSDYRNQLMPWSECQKRLPEYCQSLDLPASASEFVDSLRQQLTKAAEKIDQGFPANSELTIDNDGTPHLKRQKASPLPEGLDEFKKEAYERMPERHLLDILKHVQYWSNYTRHFGPPSGANTKIPDSTSRYLFTVFGYGCNLGASQTARHAPDSIHRQTLRRINSQHINASKLEAALNDVIGEYVRFELPSFWGKSNVAIADGTQMELRKNNLLGEQHIRYGGYGGIAYHHISGEYIALFSHFISCGVWEAVYILDALLLNKSAYQPDTLHADTQGQSEPVFALAHLLGINLFPRMRTWNDVAFYRPNGKVKYEHIDSLFTKTVDWDLIETHWQDMMQVVLSIQAGKVLPSMLLRKLNSHNRRNKLYRAFRELGRVTRTLFLLRYISETDLRHTIRAETTKIESYNDFLDWVSFGCQIIKSGDPVEQTKLIKYTNLVANSIMLQNVVDLTDVLAQMASEGYAITKELVACISPYIRDQIRRFGKYEVDMEEQPPHLDPKSVPIKV
jgi:TnpA family transposase